MTPTYDAIILGGGAAGLMCAAEAGKRGRRVLVVERAERPGKKILISGGGRCNVTNIHTGPDNFLSANPHFAKSALSRYTPQDFIALVERHSIAWHEKTLGQLFCDGSARQIVDLLLDESAEGGVELACGQAITDVTHADGRFRVTTDQRVAEAPALVIATGGPSIPKMGASGFGYAVARQFGLRVVEPRPGLVPLTFDAETMAGLDGLSGISLDAVATHGNVRFREALLFTHRGLSGPVILQISSYWRPGETVVLDLLPGMDAFAMLKEAKAGEPRKAVSTVVGQWLPRRLAQRLVDWTGGDGRLADTTDKALRRLADHINAWHIVPSGSEGLRTAEVTVGGVDTRELSSKTMEARSVPGLYFIGETVDVTGHLGGFNFQWAWASGHACGQAV